MGKGVEKGCWKTQERAQAMRLRKQGGFSSHLILQAYRRGVLPFPQSGKGQRTVGLVSS